MTDANTMVERLEGKSRECISAGRRETGILLSEAAALIRKQQEENAVLRKVIDQIIERINSGGTGVRKVIDIRNIVIRAPRLPAGRREG